LGIKVLFIGDVIGKKGREILKEQIPKFKEEVDLVVVQGENLAGGFGITRKTANEVFSFGVDVITGGNHIFGKKEIYEIIDEVPIIRPYNYPPGVPGKGFIFLSCKDKTVGVLSLCGRVFMEPLDCPFRTADSAIKEIKEKTNIIIVDVHGEATSEKNAIAWWLDGRVSAVIGTHTHVQTSDTRIFPKGTGFITDVGMVGSLDSVIGVKKDTVIKRFLTNLPVRFEPAGDDGIFCAVIIEIDEKTGKTCSIEPIQIHGL